MKEMKLRAIGRVDKAGGETRIVLEERFRAGLKGLGGYGHVLALWWMDGCDNDADRNTLVERKPYRKGPDEIGVFALRSPERPNPIAVSIAAIVRVDEEAGAVAVGYLDAFPGSAVLDLKPYTPSIDRIEKPLTPAWCRHWPRSAEESGAFDWAAEFNFR